MWTAWQQWLIWWVTRPLAVIVWLLSHISSWFRSQPPVPPVANPLLLHSATTLARMIRSSKVKSADVVEAFISRVKEVNGTINAVVQERFEEALREAREVDLSLKDTDMSEEELERVTPLLGVPITVKETIPVKGMSNNGGVPGRVRVASADAEAVATLRAHGAIPLLVSNTPELCLSWESYNPVTGRTNNPYNPKRTAGGSSGGEGALLGSAASVIGLGSDIGGSGRLPASYCGVFGHKPSSGYISVQGHMPSSEDPVWTSVFVYAPMARYAEDLPLVFSASVSDKQKLSKLKLYEPVDLKRINFFFLESDPSKMSDNSKTDVKNALDKVINHIEQTTKVKVKKIEFEELKHACQVSLVLLLQMKACHSIFQKSEDNLTEWKSVAWQFVLWFLGLSPHALHALIYGAIKKFADSYSEEDVQQLRECKNIIEQKLNDYLGDDGVLLYPTAPEPAHLHDQIYYRQLNAPYLSLFNLLDMPATACPVMLNKNGLPVGIQVVASRGQDRLTLAMAKELEKAFGGWVAPTGASLTSVISDDKC